MRIAWLQDYCTIGGAELTCRETVRIGELLGHDIVGVTPQNFSSLLLYQCDVLVINNFFHFDTQQVKHILYAIYEQRVPYVVFEHDHRNLDRPDFARALFAHSRLNIFLSPMHLSNYHDRLGVDGIALPLAINVDQYRPVPGIERVSNTAIVSNMRNFKRWIGLQEYITTHPEINFTVIADQSMVYGENVTLHPRVRAEQMPGLYSRHEFLVHILDGLGAGERVIFEAALCGCKVVANEHAGHMSWGQNLGDDMGLRAWLQKAPYEFWRKIEAAVI